MRAFATTAMIVALTLPAAAQPKGPKGIERRLHSDNIDASSFLWNDWNKFVENYHPNYVADDDPRTAWVEGAKASGAGEWLRIQVTPLDRTTRVRLRVRNGYQKSKDLWKANARAKAVTVRLLPSKAERKITLADADGWQEIAVEQPSGPLRAVELAIDSVYEGSKYADLCISDVQVLATSETPDNPAFEKSKLASLMAWRGARIAASKVFAAKQVELPIYPAYEVQKATWHSEDGISPERAAILDQAAKDPVFAREWKDALAAAAALEQSLGSMTRAQLAPVSAAKLVEVDGIQITELGEIQSGEGPYLEPDAIRLPMVGLVSAMFADRLRVLDVKDPQTIPQFQTSAQACGADKAWVSRAQPKEGGPQRVTAVALGRCAKLEGRGGSYIGRTVELLVYDPTGKLVLLVGEGHVEGYRWAVDAGRPMLAGGRSLLWDGGIVDARRRGAVASK